jgi:uncharacterized membrane-anchored protein
MRPPAITLNLILLASLVFGCLMSASYVPERFWLRAVIAANAGGFFALALVRILGYRPTTIQVALGLLASAVFGAAMVAARDLGVWAGSLVVGIASGGFALAIGLIGRVGVKRKRFGPARDAAGRQD